MAPPAFAKAASYGVYQGRMREAIHALKYGRLHPAARGLGRMLAEAIAKLAAEAPGELLVVPVPLHRAKYGQRGFNQSRSLAAEALRFLRKSHPKWRLTLAPSTLMRLRSTESQAGLTPRQRRLNVRGAFSVSDPGADQRAKHSVDRRHFDHWGHGARRRAGADEGRAASVWVATLARAQRTAGFGHGLGFADAEESETQTGKVRLATS